MQTRVVLISDDSDFFEFIVPILSLRNGDELFRFSFDEIPDKVHLFDTALLIINSENKKEQTLNILELLTNSPAIIFGYNEDYNFKISALKKGAFSYFTPLISTKEIQAIIFSALKLASSLEQNERYRELLVSNNLITQNNEVFLDCNNILDREFEKIHKTATNAVLAAVSPDDKSKFSIQSNQIETIILNNIRKNDILVNFAPSKYYILLYNITEEKARKIWNKISQKFSEPIYAGFTYIGKKSRQQAVNEALNNLHREISNSIFSPLSENSISRGNFKFFREEFNKKINNIISPVFYHIQQVYNEKLFGMNIEQGVGDGYGILYIKSKHHIGTFRISSPGFSTINIDVSLYKNTDYTYSDISRTKEVSTSNALDTKRITLEPEDS